MAATEGAMELLIDRRGGVRCLYSETLDLSVFGPLTIRRASRLEPDARGRWWADLAPVCGPVLGPFACRTKGLAAEAQWLSQALEAGTVLQPLRLAVPR